MIPTMDRIHQSIGMGGPPDLGTSGALLGNDRIDDIRRRLMPQPSEEDFRQLEDLEAIHEDLTNDGDDEPDDMLGIDDELEIDNEIDLNSLSQDMSKVIDPTPPATLVSEAPIAQPQIQETDIESDEEDDSKAQDEDDEDSLPSGGNKSNKIFLIAGIAVAVIIVIIIIISSTSGSENKNESTNTNQPSNQVVSNRYANDQITPTDGTIYQDSMVIDKYFILEQDACTFIFEGYAENARAFIKASVDLETYNRYKVGARVPVTYERVTLGGKDYYMKVRII